MRMFTTVLFVAWMVAAGLFFSGRYVPGMVERHLTIGPQVAEFAGLTVIFVSVALFLLALRRQSRSVNQLRDEISEYRRMMGGTLDALGDRLKNTHSVIDEAGRLQQRVVDTEEEVRTMSRKLETSERGAAQRRSHLTERLTRIQQNLTQLDGRAKQLMRDDDEPRKLLSSIKMSVDAITAKLDELDDKVSVEDTVDDLEEQVAEIQERTSALAKFLPRLQKLQRDCSEEKERAQGLEGESGVQSLLEQAESLKDELERVCDCCAPDGEDCLEEQIEELENALEEVGDRLKTLRELHSRLEELCRQFQQDLQTQA